MERKGKAAHEQSTVYGMSSVEGVFEELGLSQNGLSLRWLIDSGWELG